MDGIPAFLDGPDNLSFGERAISVALGLGLAGAAAKPHPQPLWNVVAFVAGGYLALRGATGHCPIKAALTNDEAATPPVQ